MLILKKTDFSGSTKFQIPLIQNYQPICIIPIVSIMFLKPPFFPNWESCNIRLGSQRNQFNIKQII